MEITPQMQSVISGLAPTSSVAAPEEGGGWGRVGKNVANLIPNIVEGLGQGITTLAELGNPGSPDIVSVPKPFDIPEAKTTGDAVGDFFVGKHGLADMMGQILLPAGALGKVGRLAGISEGSKAFEFGRFAAGESIAQAGIPDSSGADIAAAGLFGGAQGPIGMFQFKKRMLLSGMLGAAHGGYEAAQRGPMAGGVTFLADTLSGLVGGHGAGEVAEAVPPPPVAGMPEGSIIRHADSVTGELAGSGGRPSYVNFGGPTGEAPDGALTMLPGFSRTDPSPSFSPNKDIADGALTYNGSMPANRGRVIDMPTAPDTAKARVTDDVKAGYGPTQPVTPPDGSLIQMPGQPTKSFQYPELFATLQKDDVRTANIVADAPGKAPLPAPPHPASVLPVEAPEGSLTRKFGARPEAPEGSLMQRAGGGPSEPVVRPEAEAPPARPAALVEAPTPKTSPKIAWTPQELAYKQDLGKMHGRSDDNELREIIGDLDNEIANAGDEGSARSYRLSREAAQDVLDSRKPAEAPEVSVAQPQAKGKVKLRKGETFGYQGELGDVERVQVLGFSNKEGTARIKFEGSAKEVTVPQSRLREAPEKVATLQKGLDPEAATVRESMEEVEGKVRNVDVSEIDRMQERAGRGKENIRPDDLHGEKYAPKKIEIDFDTHMSNGVMMKLHQIIDTVIRAVNPRIEARFVDHLPGMEASTTLLGNIKINQASVAEWFKDWPKMSTGQKSVVLARFAQLIGHETGHSALTWLRATDPAMFKALTKEFDVLSATGKYAILERFYKHLGIADEKASHMDYMAGERAGIVNSYKYLHPDALADIHTVGMEEFFSEMFSAHALGLLNEHLLPVEMRSLWDKIKGMFQKVIALFQPESVRGSLESLEEQQAFDSFTSMVENIAEGFRKADNHTYDEVMERGAKLRETEYDSQVKRSQKLEAKEPAVIAKKKMDAELQRVAKSRKDVYDPDPDFSFTGGDYGFKFAPGAPTPPGSPSRGSTIKAAFARELTQELGSALAGAVIGGVTGPGLTDGQLSMSEGILIGGVMGALGPRAIKALLAVPKAASAFQHMSFKEALAGIFKGNAEGVAADAATGHGSSVAKFMRFLERNMNLHLPPELFNAVVDADGAAAWALHTMDDAFKKVKNFKSPPAFEAATHDYLKARIPEANYRAIAASMGPEAQKAADFNVVAREAIATLQTHFISGLPHSKFKDMLVDSLAKGDYLTTQYRIHHDPKYRPSQAQIELAAVKYSSDHPAIGLDTSRQILENYVHEVKTAGTGYRGSVTDVGKKLDAYLWAKREKLDPVFRDMLGEYHDPREKVFGTIQHLYTSAITSKLVNTVTGLKDKLGLNFHYGLEEHSRAIDALKAQILHNSPPPGKTIATLQKELDTLKAYVPMDNSKRYGKLASQMVSRFVRDQLATFDSPWGLMDGSIMRSLSKFHNAVKIARAPLNPITVVRNIIAMPILTAVGGANPFTDIPRAMKLIRAGGREMREMVENGIVGVDAIKGEMLRNVDYVKMLNVDDSILGLVKKGVNHALDFYRWPDMLVRGATYLRAKAKFASELGLPETHADVIAKARDWTNRYTVNYANVAPLVKSLRQIPFTNLFISYTAEITRIAKNLAQDMFSHEDVGQRIRAASLLGGLASAPFAIEKFSEMQLSDADRKEWKKAKGLMPDYQRTKHLIVTGREKDGRFRYFDMTPLTQIDSLTQMGRAIAGGDMAALAAVNPVISWENTPAINIVSEQITGTDLRTGRPIDKNILTRAKAVLDDIVPPVLPGGYEFRRWSDALSRTDTGDLGITNARTGRRTTPAEIVGSYLTGMRFGTVDADKLSQFAVADAKRKIANEQAYLRDVVQTNSVQRVKDKAIARYVESQKQILLELTQRLQPSD